MLIVKYSTSYNVIVVMYSVKKKLLTSVGYVIYIFVEKSYVPQEIQSIAINVMSSEKIHLFTNINIKKILFY